jgi:hypothetical protein
MCVCGFRQMVEVNVEVRILATLTRVCWMGGSVGL